MNTVEKQDSLGKNSSDSRKAAMEQTKIWEHFQNQDLETFKGNAPRLEFILKKMQSLSQSSNPKVLNIGVGNGYFEKCALDMGFQIHALDPDEKAIERLKKLGIPGKAGVMTALPFESDSFDFVVASEVLEHLTPEETPAALQEVRRILKPGAAFIGTVPFNELLKDNESICPNCSYLFHRWGHQQSYTKEKLQSVLKNTLTLEQLKVRSFVTFKGRGFKGKLKSAFKWILGAMGEQVADPHIYFETRKK